MKANFYLLVCLLQAFIILLSSCTGDATYQGKHDFKEKYWPKSEPVVFEFKIKDIDLAYDFNYFVRNSIDYPYQNIYLQYFLEDSAGNVISKQLNNVELFNPKTGKPIGTGVGDIYSLEKTFLSNFSFSRPGTYRIRIDQYMRQDTLKHIHTVGFSLKKAE